MAASFVIESLNGDSPALQSLLRKSTDYMSALYPAESNHLEDVEALLPSAGFLVGVFVLEEHRGRGISKAIMQTLEARLVAHGVRVARLETGIRQPEAIGLYRRLGYAERPPFGSYRPDPLSIFMEKRLGG